jgi:hypothetical protein
MEKVCRLRLQGPIKSWTSLRQNGVSLLSVYSPGRRRNKKARVIILVVAWQRKSLMDDSCDKDATRWMTWIGMGLKWRGAGLEDFQDLIIRCRWKSIRFAEFRQGSSAPTLKYIWATCSTEPSADQARTALPLADSSPQQTRTAKICRNGIFSGKAWRKRSRPKPLVKSLQMAQAVMALEAQPGEIPVLTAS